MKLGLSKDSIITILIFIIGFLLYKSWNDNQELNGMKKDYSNITNQYGNVYLPKINEKLHWYDKMLKGRLKPRTITITDTIPGQTIEEYLYPAIEQEPIDFIVNLKYYQNKGLIEGYSGQLKFSMIDSNFTLLNIKKKYKIYVNPKSNFNIFISPNTGKITAIETRNRFDFAKSLNLTLWKINYDFDITGFFGVKYNPSNLSIGGIVKLDNHLNFNYGVRIKIGN